MKFYGQFDPPVDKILYERYFRDFKGEGICLECGAADGIFISSTKFFEETLGWKCINIEAFPEHYKKLVINRPKSINLNVALSDSEGETFIHGKGLRSYLVQKGDVSSVPVRKTTYKKIIEENNIPHLSLMVLDVEGHEAEALNGMIGVKILPDIFCVEANPGRGQFIIDTVLKLGYVLDFRLRVNGFFKRII